MRNIASNEASSIEKNVKIPVKTSILRISDWARYVSHFEAIWTMDFEVGPKLRPCWPKLGPSGAGVAATSDRNGAFGRFCTEVQNVRITTVRTFFLAPGRS